MNRTTLFLFGTALLTLAACAPTAVDPNPLDDLDDPIVEEPVRETENVLYRGILTEAGVSIYMQGTHRLTLDDGRFILLESSTVDMDAYTGRRVEVLGAVRPTVEAGGQIMRVTNVRPLDTTTPPTVPADIDDDETGASSSVPAAASSVPSIDNGQSDDSDPSPSADPWEDSDELTEKTAAMARVDLSASQWTQEYCSTHWGFCIPIHRNWWYKSFGATANSLWHVEIGPMEMNNLGEGPIVVNLMNGTAESAGALDGEVRVTEGAATGYRMREDGRHFQVRGPAQLEQAIRIITEGLRLLAA